MGRPICSLPSPAYVLGIPGFQVRRKPTPGGLNSKRLASAHVTEEFTGLAHSLPGAWTLRLGTVTWNVGALVALLCLHGDGFTCMHSTGCLPPHHDLGSPRSRRAAASRDSFLPPVTFHTHSMAVSFIHFSRKCCAELPCVELILGKPGLSLPQETWSPPPSPWQHPQVPCPLVL